MHKLSSLCLLVLYARLASTSSTLAHRPNKTEVKELLAKILQFRDALNEITSPYLKITLTDAPPNCVQMQCKVICFNGKAEDIEKDIDKVTTATNSKCKVLEELQLLSYVFPNAIIPRNFLGNYTDKIESLYLGNSNVTDFEDGAFGNGIFQKFKFENLKLISLRRGLFKNVNSYLMQSLTVVQNDPPLESIWEGTFDDVKYRIKSLTLQVGITCIRNVTASNALLNKLSYVDFSYNNLGDDLHSDAFDMLSMVEHLSLASSNISVLPDYIFYRLDLLQYLDLSGNHLTTISSYIFGWIEFSDLKLFLSGNDWDCTCKLQHEMKTMFGQNSPILSCKSPAEFATWSVFDEGICADEAYSTALATTEDAKSTTHAWTTITTISAAMPPISPTDSGGGANSEFPITSSGSPYFPSTTAKPPLNSLIDLECQRPPNIELFNLKIQSASMDFTVKTLPNLSVDVVLKGPVILDESYGLIWFSNVTKEYYKMEVNYNQYGFGCFGSISYWTTVNDLSPNMAYTFCLVLRDKLTISPFNCKSTHIPGNLGVRYNAWLTRDLRATGISMFILGVVIFTFVGIVAIFILLKNKPTLLKGSKRVATTKGNMNEIVVLPKDRTLQDLRHKEEMLAKRNSKSVINALPQRRNSTDSNVSYQSYMNANLYEELPAYFKVDPNLSFYNTTEDEKDYSYNYIPTLSNDCDKVPMVSYAEIPFRHKRTSNDPLPAVPKENEALQSGQQMLPVMDKDLDLSPAYFAFTHDSSV